MFTRPVRTLPAVEPASSGSTPLAFVFILAHIPLALAMRSQRPLVALHAAVVVGVALAWAISGRRPERVAWCLAYITGAEVLWRMTHDQLFWELGKYATVLVAGVWLVRARAGATLAYPGLAFVLLLPSAVLSFQALGFAEARNQLSFNLSGPLALAICCAFFLNVNLNARNLRGLFLALIAPVCAIATLAFVGIITNPDLRFTTESNFETSGGFGPNQVSAALGLGALSAFLLVLEKESKFAFRAGLLMVLVWLAGQSAMTFSRGGLYTAGAAMLAAWLALVNDPRELIKPVLVALILVPLTMYVIWPRLDAFTEGNLTARFADTGTTKRGGLGEDDLSLFLQNPLLGVGPGVSKLTHDNSVAAHTEFTRLLAEHGLFGVTALLSMLSAGAWNLLRATSARERAIGVALLAWSMLFMLNSAMRLVAPSFAFGLTCAAIQPLVAAQTAPAQAPARRRGPRLLRPVRESR